jgi:hypothetical protein
MTLFRLGGILTLISAALLVSALAFGGMGPCGPSNFFGILGLVGGVFGFVAGMAVFIVGSVVKGVQSFTHHSQD